MMCAAHAPNAITSGMDAKFATVGCMATVIIQIIRQKGECLPQDLYGKGFSSKEITEHWHMAESLAAVELRLSQCDGGEHG